MYALERRRRRRRRDSSQHIAPLGHILLTRCCDTQPSSDPEEHKARHRRRDSQADSWNHYKYIVSARSALCRFVILLF